MSDEYISIKEFSDNANVTPQAIYKAINSNAKWIKNNYKRINKRYYIKIDAIKDYEKYKGGDIRVVKNNNDSRNYEQLEQQYKKLKESYNNLQKKCDEKEKRISILTDDLRDDNKALKNAIYLFSNQSKENKIKPKQIQDATQNESEINTRDCIAEIKKLNIWQFMKYKRLCNNGYSVEKALDALK